MKQIWKTSKSYIAAFSIPYLLLLILHFYFESGHGNPIMGVLQPLPLIVNGLASCCLLFYFKNTPGIPFANFLHKDGYQLLFAVAYGMCSYPLVQESNFTVLLSYGVFPLVFLAFEYMIHNERYVYFIFSEAILFIISPDCGAFVFSFFLVLTFFELGIQKKLNAATFLHCFSCMLLAFLLAAFRFLPYFEYSDFSFPLFNLSYFPDMVLSRFLPGSIASIAYGAQCGTDIYFGLLFLFPLCLFFINKSVPAGKRICYGCFTLFLLLAIYVSPVRDIFHMGVRLLGYSVPYSFVLSFWCLRLSYEAWQNKSSASRKEIYGSICLVFLWIAVSFTRYSGNVVFLVIPLTLVLFLLYTTLLCIRPNSKGIGNLAFPLLFLLVICELTTNAWLCTDIRMFSSKRGLYPSYLWENEALFSAGKNIEEKQTDVSGDKHTADTGNPTATSSSPHTDENLTELLNQLDSAFSLSPDEYLELCQTKSPNFFERYNALAKKAGLEETLFTKTAVSISWEESSQYQIVSQTETLFNFRQYVRELPYVFTIPFELVKSEESKDTLCLYNELSGELFCFTDEELLSPAKEKLTFQKRDEGTLNFEVLSYSLNDAVMSQLSTILTNYAAEDIEQPTVSLYTYAGIGLTCLGVLIFLSLFFNSDKEKVYQVLLSIKAAVLKWRFPGKIAAHIKRNFVYYLAFFIPILTFIAGMVMTYCTPFGNGSFFDEDGLHLTLPSYLDCYYNLKEGNTYLSMNGGYGFNQYANHPLIRLLSFFPFLEADWIAPFLLFAEAVCLGLCAVSVVFYLTHRLQGKAACKKDYLLLIPALIYSMNAYMLAMHSFTGWYYTLLAFPLLLCAMEYMLYRKKTLPYVLLLSYCIISNLYLALYICIFLVVYFFTCHFDGITDFLKKGIRFGLCSLLAAGNSFFIISNTLLSSVDSPYQKDDVLLPTFGLHTSFLEQWKKHMIFSKVQSVSSDDGMLNIYCSIFALFLLLIYFSSKKIHWKEKLQKLIPLMLLYISFNERILSYIWNGFHYQTKVPNRYAFLLLFLLAVLCYDSIQELEQVSGRKMGLFTGCLVIFFGICQFCSSGNSTLSWVMTMILCGCYLLLHLLRKQFSGNYHKVITLVILGEICLNSLYSMLHYNNTCIQLYGDYKTTAEYIEEKTGSLDSATRIIFPASLLINNGQIYHANTTELFNSYVTQHQNKTNTIYGLHSGTRNYMRSLNSSTPFGLSLCGTRYLFLPSIARGQVEDLSHYKYVGKINNYYVFENPNALSYGFYVPDTISSLEYDVFPAMFYNKLASLYTDEGNEIFVSQYISYNDDENASESFYLTDFEGNKLSYEEALSYSENFVTDDVSSNLLLHINYTPKKDGYVYLFTHEFISLGQAKAGERITKTIPFSEQMLYFREDYNLAILNDDNMEHILSILAENQWENVKVQNNCITGTTNYEADGYTMLSIAWDQNWHAYIDGEEVEIEDFYDAMMFIKTPAGKHTLTLEYIPYGMKTSKMITLGFWLLTALLYGAGYLLQKKKTATKATQ